MNDYVQRRSEITSSQNTINTHLVEDFTSHSLMHVERRETSNIVNNIVNEIRVNNVFENNVNNIIYNNLYSGMSGPPEYYPSITYSSIEDLIIDIGEAKLIPQEKRICGINLEEINVDQKYMSCAECSNNFNEISIRIWLTQRRTCPSCRGNWSDFNVYINS
jgi:hypothetical protein